MQRYSSDPHMGHLTLGQLQAGITKGREKLVLVDAMKMMDAPLYDGHGAFDRPSKDYEAWAARSDHKMREALLYAISETEKEIARRAGGHPDA